MKLAKLYSVTIIVNIFVLINSEENGQDNLEVQNDEFEDFDYLEEVTGDFEDYKDEGNLLFCCTIFFTDELLKQK